MRKTSTLLLGGLSLFLALPVLASAGGVGRRLPPDHIQKTTLVEVKGVLQRIDVFGDAPLDPTIRDKMRRGWPALVRSYWQITAQGKTYRLDFGSSKESAARAAKLNGKTVLVAGRLAPGMDLGSILDRNGVAIMSFPIYFDALVVSRLEAIETEAVRTTVQVEALGMLGFREVLRYRMRHGIVAGREWQGYVVRVGGQDYLLQFGADGKLADLASKLRGQQVRVTGRLESWSDHGGCVGEQRHHPLIVVTDLRAA